METAAGAPVEHAIALRLSLFFAAPIGLLPVVQLLHALTFGASHLVAKYFLAHNVPPGLAATAQGVYGAVAVGAVFGLTMLVAGGLCELVGGAALFAMAGRCVAPMFAALWLDVGEGPRGEC